MSTRLFYSTPAKAMMYLAIPVIIITQYAKFNAFNIITQLLVYLAIAYNAECLVEGGCGVWAWLSVALPILYSLLYIFFGNQLGLRPTPPSPITNIMPVQRIKSRESSMKGNHNNNSKDDIHSRSFTFTHDINPNENIVYVDEQGNVLTTVEANTHLSGEPLSNSGQPVPTSGNLEEAFSF